MKTTLALAPVFILLAALFIYAGNEKGSDRNVSDQQPILTYPADIKTIIDNKCYGCHSVQGKSEDARKALMWDNLPSLTKAKQVATLDDIIDVLDDGSMPPKKFVEMRPEAKLTDEESQALKNWAETTADNLLK
jgi:uncharacterized membrane protein